MSTTFHNTVFKQRPEEFIISSLSEAGVENFWIGSAMDWIRRCLAGNKYFVRHVESVEVEVDKLKFAARVEIKGVSVYPDEEKTLEADCAITYTFDKKSHKVSIKAKDFRKPRENKQFRLVVK
jgi:hypothetical protein